MRFLNRSELQICMHLKSSASERLLSIDESLISLIYSTIGGPNEKVFQCTAYLYMDASTKSLESISKP